MNLIVFGEASGGMIFFYGFQFNFTEKPSDSFYKRNSHSTHTNKNTYICV